MKTSLLSLVTGLVLFATTAASAATISDHDHGPRRPSPRERARYEAARREQANYLARQRAAERAHFEAMHHHHDRRNYSYNHR